jgi:hypothetical protein
MLVINPLICYFCSMKVLNFLFLFLGLNIFLIFLLKREWLFNKKTFGILLCINVVLFILGIFLQTHPMGDSRFSPLLKVPFIYQILLLPLAWIYRKIYHKDPVDTLWSMDIRLMKDGVFNFIYTVLLFVVVIMVY